MMNEEMSFTVLDENAEKPNVKLSLRLIAKKPERAILCTPTIR